MTDVVQWVEEDLQDPTLILESRLVVDAPEAMCLVGQSSETKVGNWKSPRKSASQAP